MMLLMTAEKNTKTTCNICGSGDISNLGRIINGHYSKNFLKDYSLLECKKCSLRFIYPIPSNDVLNFIYSDPQYKTQWGVVKENEKSSRYLNFEYYFKIISNYKSKKDVKVLDCGCATGCFLDVAEKNGIECYGVETSEIPYKIAENKHPKKVCKSNMEDLKIKDGFFDIITMFDFIEHVKDPRKILIKANRLLSKSGILFIVTPDTESLSISIMGKSHNDYIIEHLHLFNKSNIRYFLKRYGFKTIKIQPAKKVINLDFAEKVFKRHTNIFYYPIHFINKLLPKKITQFPIKLSFGGMLIIAKKAK